MLSSVSSLYEAPRRHIHKTSDQQLLCFWFCFLRMRPRDHVKTACSPRSFWFFSYLKIFNPILSWLDRFNTFPLIRPFTSSFSLYLSRTLSISLSSYNLHYLLLWASDGGLFKNRRNPDSSSISPTKKRRNSRKWVSTHCAAQTISFTALLTRGSSHHHWSLSASTRKKNTR